MGRGVGGPCCLRWFQAWAGCGLHARDWPQLEFLPLPLPSDGLHTHAVVGVRTRGYDVPWRTLDAVHGFVAFHAYPWRAPAAYF